MTHEYTGLMDHNLCGVCVCLFSPNAGTECYLNWSTWDPDPTRLPSPAQVFYECDLFPNREIQMKMRQGPLQMSGVMEGEKGREREREIQSEKQSKQ